MNDFTETTEIQSAAPVSHTASVQPLTLLPGVYAFSIPGSRAEDVATASANGLRLPALSVGPAPVPQSSRIQQFTSPGTLDRWLTQAGDRITVRIMETPATMMIHSVRPADAPPLSLEVKRLDIPLATAAPAALNIMIHVQRLGDLHFNEGTIQPVDAGLAIEAFIIDSRDPDGTCIVEYRARTGDQFETPWLTDNMLCGSRGRGVPLMGFAIRTRYTASTRFDFKYRGCFRQAGWVDVEQAGDWCQSPEPNDPLLGIELYRTERT